MDAIGPLPRFAGGKEYIIVGVDYMTRWVEAVSTSRITAKDVARFVFNNICCRFGVPLEIIFDRGPGFRGDLVKELISTISMDSNKHISILTALIAMTTTKGIKMITEESRDNLKKKIDHHLKLEQQAIDTYRELWNQLENEKERLLIKTILNDEIRHHELLKRYLYHKKLLIPNPLQSENQSEKLH